MSNIGSRCGIISGSRENSLYNALWVGQALLRKGYYFLDIRLLGCWFLVVVYDTKKSCFLYRSAKNVSKRMLIFTNEDDPFGTVTGATKKDMIRTTLQRAKVLLFHAYFRIETFLFMF